MIPSLIWFTACASQENLLFRFFFCRSSSVCSPHECCHSYNKIYARDRVPIECTGHGVRANRDGELPCYGFSPVICAIVNKINNPILCGAHWRSGHRGYAVCAPKAAHTVTECARTMAVASVSGSATHERCMRQKQLKNQFHLTRSLARYVCARDKYRNWNTCSTAPCAQSAYSFVESQRTTQCDISLRW